MKLRGKKVLHNPVKTDFTKIPNELFGISMNHIDKLVLMRLYYYPPDFILAFTRLSQELSIGKTTIKDSWKRLKKQGFIIEDDNFYRINLNATGNHSEQKSTASGLEQKGTADDPINVGTGNDPKHEGTASDPMHKGTIGTAIAPMQNQVTGDDPIKGREMDTSGSASDHRLVQQTTQDGTPDVPNEEETKEEDVLNKTEEEPLVVGDCGVGSDVATHPVGVAPSSPPQPQLGVNKNITVSKYARNENERLKLLTGYDDYLKNNPNSGLTFNSYEDLLVLVVYGYEEYTNNWTITKWDEVVNLINSDSNIKLYNTYINRYGTGLMENTENIQQVFKQLKQNLIESNK